MRKAACARVALLCWLFTGGTGLDAARQAGVVTSRGATIAGTVRDPNGAPLTGVAIVVFPRDEARWPTGDDAARQALERTSGPGSYRLTNIPAGTYFIAALNDSMLREWPSVALLRRLTVKAFPVEVAAGESVTLNLSVAITGSDSGIVRAARLAVVPIPLGTPPPGVVVPGGTAIIAGRVVDANNQPVPRLQVRAVRPLQRDDVTTIGTFGQPALTDADGTFRIENLRPGSYLVAALSHVVTAPTPASAGPSSRYQMPLAAAAASGLGYITTLYPGVTSASEARAIELTDGARATANFALQRGPVTTLTGAMSKGEGRVHLTLVPTAPLDQIGGVGTQATATSDDGGFRFTEVSAGKYTIIGNSALGWVQAPVTVDTNQRQPIMLDLRPPLTVSGTVRFDGVPPTLTGPNVQPFLITLLGTGGPGASGTGVSVRPSGEFMLRVAPGSYRLLLNAPAPWQIASAIASGVDLTSRSFAVTGDMTGIVILLREGGR